MGQLYVKQDGKFVRNSAYSVLQKDMMEGLDLTTKYGDKCLSFKGGYNNRKVVTWEAPGINTDMEVLALIGFPESNEAGIPNYVKGAALYIMLKLSGTPNNERSLNLRLSGLTGTPGKADLSSYTIGITNTEVANGPFIRHDRKHFVRFRVEGTTAKVKIWEQFSTEPGSWQLEHTDALITGTGKIALGGFYMDTWFYEFVSAGVNGASAPSPGTTPGTNQFYEDFSSKTIGSIPSGWTDVSAGGAPPTVEYTPFATPQDSLWGNFETFAMSRDVKTIGTNYDPVGARHSLVFNRINDATQVVFFNKDVSVGEKEIFLRARLIGDVASHWTGVYWNPFQPFGSTRALFARRYTSGGHVSIGYSSDSLVYNGVSEGIVETETTGTIGVGLWFLMRVHASFSSYGDCTVRFRSWNENVSEPTVWQQITFMRRSVLPMSFWNAQANSKVGINCGSNATTGHNYIDISDFRVLYMRDSPVTEMATPNGF